MHLVDQVGKETATAVMRGVVTSASDLHEAKTAIAFATLTSGNANRTLQDIIQKAKNGELITQLDVKNLAQSALEDKSGPDGDRIGIEGAC